MRSTRTFEFRTVFELCMEWWTQPYRTRTPPSSEAGAWLCPLPRTIGFPRTWLSKLSASSWRITGRFQRPCCGPPPGYLRARRPSDEGSAAFELRRGWPAVFEAGVVTRWARNGRASWWRSAASRAANSPRPSRRPRWRWAARSRRRAPSASGQSALRRSSATRRIAGWYGRPLRCPSLARRKGRQSRRCDRGLRRRRALRAAGPGAHMQGLG